MGGEAQAGFAAEGSISCNCFYLASFNVKKINRIKEVLVNQVNAKLPDMAQWNSVIFIFSSTYIFSSINSLFFSS